MPRIDGLRGFRTLASGERQRIAAATREMQVAAGTVLFRKGEAADGLWAVKEGVVHIVRHGTEGRDIVLEVVPAGELFGAVVALNDKPYPADAIAVEPSVIWRLPAALARDLCNAHPTLRSAILDQVATRLHGAHERLRSIALERVEQRLARMLLTLADKIGVHATEEVRLNVTRQEIADMIGTTVETVIRITSKLQQAKAIGSSRHEIRLLDLEALRKVAEGKS
jgi:CRP/FNR family transcriptional regulator